MCVEPDVVHAAGTPCSITPVLTEANLNTCIAEAPTDNSEFAITIGADFNITAIKNIPANKNITLTSIDPSNPATLTRDPGYTGRIFSIYIPAPGIVTLTLDSVIIDGGSQTAVSVNQLIYTHNTGDITVNLAGNTVLKNNNSLSNGGTIFIGSVSSKLNMSGSAQIINNTATDRGNVFVGGTFIMSGGKISGNTASGGSGGGVHVYIDGEFVLLGGEISDNTAENGGGIYVAAGGTANITSGTIGSNIAGIDGGGVYAEDYDNLLVGASAIFSGNRAASSSPVRNPAFDAVYATNILGTNWTTPFTQGYNNYDINHDYEAPYVPDAPETGLFGGQISGATVSTVSVIASAVVVVAMFASRKLLPTKRC